MFHILSIDERAWHNYISEKTEAMIFHHPAWIQNLTNCYGYPTALAVVMDDRGHIRAGVPFAEVNSFLTGRRLISLPFSDYCCPLSDGPEELDQLMDGLTGFQAEKDVPWEIRWHLPDRPGVHAADDYVYHTTTLDPDAEVVFNRIHRKVRKYIRSSINRGVRVVVGTDQEFLEKFYHHQLITRRKHGLPAQPWKYFSLLGLNLMEKGLGEVYLAYAGEDCLAGLVVLHWGTTLTLKYGASDEARLRELRPNHQLDWSAIQWGCANGYQTLDVGRSDIDQDGLREYKNRWGYEERPLQYSWLGGEPKPQSGSGMFANVFHSAIRMAPLWANQTVGDVLYKHFP